jgi:chain length determinant protein EpsF
MNPAQLLAALRARYGMLCLVASCALLAALAVSFTMPKSYEAQALLLVDAGREEQSLSNVLIPPREREGYMQTQTDILTSERVARKAVRDLGLVDSPVARAAFEESGATGALEDWLVERLRRGLEVATAQGNVIELRYASPDPGHAARVVNGVAQAYIDTMLELRVEPTRRAAEWFDEQLKSLRQNLTAAQDRLTRYHREHGIVSVDERNDVENARLEELSSQLLRAQGEAMDLRARERQARAALEAGAAAERLPDVLASDSVRRLKAELARAEAGLVELSTQYGPAHPRHERQRTEVRSLREKLDAETARVVASLGNARGQAEQRGAQLAAALAAQRARLLDLKESRNQLAVLARDVETAQRTYEMALQRSVVSQVESRASQTNVALLNPAAVPRRPASPRIALNVALALAVGLLLGAGIVVLQELADRRVRTRADLLTGVEAPLLAELGTWKHARLPRRPPALPAPG